MDFWKIFLVVFLAELPCMIRTTGLQLSSNKIWDVIWGTTLGNVLALVFGLAAAAMLTWTFDGLKLEERHVNWFTGALFILLGLYVVFFGD